MLHIQFIKNYEIICVTDVTNCIDRITSLNIYIIEIEECISINNLKNINILENKIELIINELISLIKKYGTQNIDDILYLCSIVPISQNNFDLSKFELIQQFFHPISFKIINKKENASPNVINTTNDITNTNIIINSKIENFTCYDISSTYIQFYAKVYGIKLCIYDLKTKKNIIIFGIVDNINIDFLTNNYVSQINKNINIQQNDEFNIELFNNFLKSFTLKDYLILTNTNDILLKYSQYIIKYNNIKQLSISNIISDFISSNLFTKRLTIINLLINSFNCENQYIAYLLYDLLSDETSGDLIDTQEQILIYDSFPWDIKTKFKLALKKTNTYTNELTKFDMNKVPLEQQICLMKANNSVKEKAMIKLKEFKSKSDDSGTKARHYLDGLLKIPFEIYKKEKILSLMCNIKTQFKKLFVENDMENIVTIPEKHSYTSIEIIKYINLIKSKIGFNNELSCALTNDNKSEKLHKLLLIGNKKTIINNVMLINKILKNNKLTIHCIKYNNIQKNEIINQINNYIIFCKNYKSNSINLIDETYKYFINKNLLKYSQNIININKNITQIGTNLVQIKEYMEYVRNTMDKSVYGHNEPKTQIERIIGQWINGTQDGYCIGFEGPPGVGKTTLAKNGLADCLKDENGESRPFAMIQMGGDSNGSTLNGHNYTYVGSNWGSIVQILIDKKCMNPIIFIDELDKISKTEQGKELVGILTHLLDSTQNDCFQDKYFNGIDIDLSKALFIISYNDASIIDKILLDRVHRIKFNGLSLNDKLVVANSHILPEIYKKMGLINMVEFKEDALKFIIEEYTMEQGVRRLKNILYEIVGEININVLKTLGDKDFPIVIGINELTTIYFKNKQEIITRMVPSNSQIGFINGMYATVNGNGGTLPIHVMFFPSNKFLELKLTSQQGIDMTDSSHVALTVAWNMTSQTQQHNLRKLYDGEYKQGIHSNPGDCCSIQKSGPSASCAVAIVIYSLINNIKIRPNIAVTGELQLTGNITAIGGLDVKIIYSIKSGINTFLFPKENKRDFDKFYEKYKNDKQFENVNFYPISHVQEAFDICFEQ